jgi:hypothetical protein
VVERSNRNVNHGLELILADGSRLKLAADSRADLEDWMQQLTRAAVPRGELDNELGHHW